MPIDGASILIVEKRHWNKNYFELLCKVHINDIFLITRTDFTMQKMRNRWIELDKTTYTSIDSHKSKYKQTNNPLTTDQLNT